MKIEDFTPIEIAEKGKYRLVKEEDLTGLLKSIVPGSLFGEVKTYGTLLRLFRAIQNYTQTDLAEKAKIERKAIYLLEEDKSKSPKVTTHEKLVKVFGKNFDALAKELRLLE